MAFATQSPIVIISFENSTNENGFGIGMPLALSILKGQGGDIDVDFGGMGEGTTFILKFFK